MPARSARLALAAPALFALMLAGCGDSGRPTFARVGGPVAPDRAAAPADPGGAPKAEPVALADAAAPAGESYGGSTPAPGTVVAPPTPAPPREPKPQSGTLTAGSFDDVADPIPLGKFVRKLQLPDGLAGRFASRPLVVRVTDSDGDPVPDAAVAIAGPGNGTPLKLTTRTDGRCVVVPGWDDFGADAELTVTTMAPGGKPVTAKTTAASGTCDVKLPAKGPGAVRKLDLALVIDTTGSMGDEIRYVQAEMAAIVESVRRDFPQVEQRYALVLYKDTGDEYVTRTFNFTDKFDDFRKNLAAASAGGGGDGPEAVERALEDAGQLSWRDGAARVAFLIADAPPHDKDMRRTLNAVNVLRGRGVAVYPVAASGTDDAAEFVLRASAVLTGAQYLFLTDDSGVGLPHAEPHIPHYVVQRLDRLMARMIAAELSGKPVEAKAADVIRQVGQRQARGQ